MNIMDSWRVTGALDAQFYVAAFQLEFRDLFLDKEFDEVFDLFLVHLFILVTMIKR